MGGNTQSDAGGCLARLGVRIRPTQLGHGRGEGARLPPVPEQPPLRGEQKTVAAGDLSLKNHTAFRLFLGQTTYEAIDSRGPFPPAGGGAATA